MEKFIVIAIVLMVTSPSFADLDCSDKELEEEQSSQLTLQCGQIYVYEQFHKKIVKLQQRMDEVINYEKEHREHADEWISYREEFNDYLSVYLNYSETECTILESVPRNYGSGLSSDIADCMNNYNQHMAERVLIPLNEKIDDYFKSVQMTERRSAPKD